MPAGGGRPPHPSHIAPPDNPFPNGGLNARLIWAFGLRNPFRFHIDPLNGALFIGDVGEDVWEEVDRAPAGGLDFGWSRFECPELNDPACTLSAPATPPIHAYDRSGETAAIVVAGPYRRPVGALRPFSGAYEGDVFFSDFYLGFLRRLKQGGTGWVIAAPVAGQPNPDDWATGLGAVSDYAVGPDGSLWYSRQYVTPTLPTGEIRRIVRAGVVAVPPPGIQNEGRKFDKPSSKKQGTQTSMCCFAISLRLSQSENAARSFSKNMIPYRS